LLARFTFKRSPFPAGLLYVALFVFVSFCDQLSVARIDNEPGELKSEPLGNALIVKFHA
jgi:hypothetical protein